MVFLRDLQEFGWYLEIDLYVNGFNSELLSKNLEVVNEVMDLLESSEEVENHADKKKVDIIKRLLNTYACELNESLETMKLYESHGEQHIVDNRQLTYNELQRNIRITYGNLLQVFTIRLKIKDTLVSLAWVNRYHQSSI